MPDKTRNIFLLYVLCFVTFIVNAQQENIIVKLSDSVLHLQQRFKLEYKVINKKIDSIITPKFKGVKVIAKENSTNVTYKGDKIERTASYSFSLRAVKSGAYTIPATEIYVNGKPFLTRSLKLNIINSTYTKEENLIHKAIENISLHTEISNKNLKKDKSFSITYSLCYNTNKLNVYDVEVLDKSFKNLIIKKESREVKETKFKNKKKCLIYRNLTLLTKNTKNISLPAIRHKIRAGVYNNEFDFFNQRKFDEVIIELSTKQKIL